MCERCRRNTTPLAECTGGGPADGEVVPVYGTEMFVPTFESVLEPGEALAGRVQTYRLRRSRRTGELQYFYVGLVDV
jgi:hypothetical protein